MALLSKLLYEEKVKLKRLKTHSGMEPGAWDTRS